jgi:S-adenosylmethionine/arginine decarboxylase-like enzyme
MHHRGHHVLLDYVIDTLPAADELAAWLMDVLESSIKAQGINIVHQHCEVFDGSVSPPGFAAVLLLDESHCSAHCYSELGMLAIDVFSCGGQAACPKTTAVADAVDAALRQRFSVTRGDRDECPRFPTAAAAP